MQETFRTTLPKRFVENTLAICGERGDQWLNDLPAIISELEIKWSILVRNHFQNLSYNYVANATTHGDKNVVVKIGMPLENNEIDAEAAYLQVLDGKGGANLLQVSPDLRAILLERVVPGSNLKAFCKKDQANAVDISIRVLKRILRPPNESEHEFMTLDNWFGGLRRAIGTNFPQVYASRAIEYYAELSRDAQNIFLLHGDFHHDNILSASRESFLVIDPKGIVGHVGYDIGVFLNNHHDWLETNTQLQDKLDRAVSDFAVAFDLNEVAIRKWTYCQMVLSWWWTFDEMPSMFDGELGLSDIWKV